jgi:hypothetical protein
MQPKRCGLLLALALLAAALPALAFDYPLSSTAIREAYFLGKEDAARRAEFLAKYTHKFPTPKTGPYVAFIQFGTPYLVVAEEIARNLANYSAPDAEEEFLGKPAICRVRVQIYYGNFPGLPSSAGTASVTKDHVIHLTQHDRQISSQASSSKALYSSGRTATVTGTERDLEFDPDTIDSAAPVKVEILMPDGQDVETTFDLARLR